MGKPVVHFDIGCRDLDVSTAFYSELFDWSASDYGPLSKQFDTQTEEGIPGHTTALGHEPHNYVMVYVEVEDIALYLSKVEELGGQIVLPETPIPNGGHFAWFKDPSGNTLGLIKH